jgi:hypothetical protein
MGLDKCKCSGIIVLIAVLICACGYRFGGQSGFPGDSDRLFVKVLENRTQETGVENIASGIDHADVVLSGVVEEVTIKTISTRNKDTAGERRVTVSVDLELKKQDGSVVWAANGLTDNEGYPVDADGERTDQNRRGAIRVLSQRIAEQVVNRMSDDF